MSRVLTVMFTDIKGFTERTSTRSRTDLRRLLSTHEDLLRPLFDQCCGHVVKTIGDAFMVVFDSPTNAVICGMLIQDTLEKYNEKASATDKLHVRVAINTGEVEISKGDVYGEAVNIAARIEAITEADEIYFTESVYLNMQKSEVPTAEVGKRTLKGIPFEVKVYRVLRDTKDPRWSDLLERARSGQLKSASPDFSLPFGQRAASKMMVPALALGAMMLIAAIAVMLFNNGAGGGGGAARDAQQNEAVQQAETLIAANKEGEARDLLEKAPEGERVMATIGSSVKHEANRLVDEKGDLDTALKLIAEWSEKRPSLSATLNQEKLRLIDVVINRAVTYARETLAARAAPGPDKQKQEAADRLFREHRIALFALLEKYDQNVHLQNALVDLTRAETERLVAENRYALAKDHIGTLSERRGYFSDRLKSTLDTVNAAFWDYRVLSAVKNSEEMIRNGEPQPAVDELGKLIAEKDDQRLTDALVVAIDSRAEQLFGIGQYDKAVEVYESNQRLYPRLTTLGDHKVDLKKRIEVMVQIQGIRRMITEGEYKNAVDAADRLQAAQPQRDDLKDLYRQALQEYVTTIVAAGDYEGAVGLLDTAHSTHPWLGPADESVRKVVLTGAEKLPRQRWAQQANFWRMVYKRFPTDVEMATLAVDFWLEVSNYAAMEWISHLATLPGTDEILQRKDVLEAIWDRCDELRARDYKQISPVLDKLPRQLVVERLTEIVQNKEASYRDGAFEWLKAHDACPPELEFNYHWLAFNNLRMDRASRRVACDYFLAQKEAGNLEALKAKVLDKLEFDYLDAACDTTDLQEMSVRVLRECFLDQSMETLLAEVTGMKGVTYRRGCYMVLQGTPGFEKIDLMRYHTENITDYSGAIYLYPFVHEAIDFFGTQKGTEHEAAARQALIKGSRHLEAVFEDAGDNGFNAQHYKIVRKWFDDVMAKYGIDRSSRE
ncbi:MAG: adenylate/guanylate cyclase domain-containing protein [Planctomycetota bacterium]